MGFRYYMVVQDLAGNVVDGANAVVCFEEKERQVGGVRYGYEMFDISS